MIKLFFIFIFISISAFCKEIVLTENNFVLLEGNITISSINRLKEEFEDKVQKNNFNDFYIVINSGGGEIDAGIEFINVIKKYRNTHGLVIYSGSMAAAILQQVPGKRYCFKNCQVMFHEGTMYIQEARANRRYIKDLLNTYNKDFEDFELLNYSRLNLTKEQFQEKIDGKDWKIYGEDNLKQNSVDEMVLAKCSKDIENKKINKTVNTMFGPVQVQRSLCPL